MVWASAARCVMCPPRMPRSPLLARARYFARFAAAAVPLALVLGPVSATGCARRSGSEQVPSPATPGSPPAGPSALVAAGHGAAIAEGGALYGRYCRLCHGEDATGYAADNAPSLVSRTFLESASDAFIAAGIRDGRSNTAMAAYGKSRGGPLADHEIDAIVKFLRAKGPAYRPLPEAPLTGDPLAGERLFKQQCRSCHGGPNQRATAPQLHNPEFLAQSTPGFWRYAIRHGRPPAPMPAFGETLTEAQIEDVVAWLGKLAGRTSAAPPPASAEVPADLPLVINPKGRPPSFVLREGRFVSAEQVKNALAQKRRLVIVDARTPSDWLQLRIPGSVPIPYYDTEKLERIPNDGTWVVAYCACPHHASGEVVDALRKRNYPNTAVLDEGILFWKDRGYPLAGAAAANGPTEAPAARPQPAPRRSAPPSSTARPAAPRPAP